MTPRPWDAAALDALAPSAAVSPFGPLATPAEMFQGAQLWEYSNGKQHALVAVRLVTFAAGRRLDVVGLRSDGDRLDVGAFDAAVVRLAHDQGARIIAMCTQLPHVARSCLRHGWGTTGAVLLKVLQ